MKKCFWKSSRFSIRISMSIPSHHHLLLGFLGLCILKSLALSQNHTLIFSKDNNFRNCSCSIDIQSCDYSLANLMCNCKTISLTKNKTSTRLSYHGDLTVWFSDTSTLGKLVNFTFVHSLKLALCGNTTLPTEYLAILGLHHLRVQTDAKLEQSLTLHNGSDPWTNDRPCPTSRDRRSPLHISYLDTSVFNKLALLKSYSVENVSSILEHFPNLPFSSLMAATNKSYIVTLIY